MERESTQTITREQRVHEFICDSCGETIGTSVEFDDGVYQTLGAYNQAVCINGIWYKLHANYCNECARNKTAAILEALDDLGFERN